MFPAWLLYGDGIDYLAFGKEIKHYGLSGMLMVLFIGA
jgi:hypothetical protein